MKKPFVVYWNNIPAPYMVERFNALAERGSLDFEAWFNERRESDRSWEVDETKWKFSHRYLPGFRLGGKSLRFPLPILERKRPDLLVSLYSEPVFLIGWAIAKLRKVKTVFRVLKTQGHWEKRHWAKERLKLFLFSQVDGIETPGAEGKAFAMRYGAKEERTFLATHTVSSDYHFYNYKKDSAEIRKLKHELGLQGLTFIYVGRLWWGKGVNYLLEAFSELQRRGEIEISLLIVGDGKDEIKLKQQCRDQNIQNVVFVGFKQMPDLLCYYAVGDVFVFPTLGDPYGLVVDEAMACSLPVISTSAAGEIRDRIEEGVNGYIVSPRDSIALAKAMKRLMYDSKLRQQMGEISTKKIAGHTPDQWAKDFECGIERILRLSII
jgi:glycosyltransferase involved in cell wall biosynthesis